MIKKIALFLIALLPMGLMAQELKLGHINSQEILSLMPERATIEKALNEFNDQYEKETVKMRKEYDAKVKEFVDKQATMTETIKNARQSEIADMEQRISTFNQTAQSDYMKKQQELFNPVLEKVKKAISEVGAEGGYIYIFDLAQMPGIVYESPKAIDITGLVKKKLNLTGVTPKPATATPAAAPAKK